MPKLHFTANSVQSAKCEIGKTRTVYSDRSVAGLTLEVRSTGGKTYYVRYIDQYGSQRNLKVGDASSIKLATARQITIDVKSKVAMGHDPFEEKQEKHAGRFADRVR